MFLIQGLNLIERVTKRPWVRETTTGDEVRGLCIRLGYKWSRIVLNVTRVLLRAADPFSSVWATALREKVGIIHIP